MVEAPAPPDGADTVAVKTATARKRAGQPTAREKVVAKRPARKSAQKSAQKRSSS
jgi:hypothetical protein